MNSLEKRLKILEEKTCIHPDKHLVWREEGQSEADAIGCRDVQPGDKVIFIGWLKTHEVSTEAPPEMSDDKASQDRQEKAAAILNEERTV